MKGNGGKLQPEWMRSVKVGDVLINAAGVYRVVRAASFYPNGNLRSVTFVIRRRSWTNRAYTVVGFTDLRMQGYRPARARSKLNGPLDAQIAKVIADHRDLSLTCCMVKGIA